MADLPQTDAAPCAAIVLAAGASLRLGRPKQLVPVEGESLLRRVVRLAIEAGCQPVVVVLGDSAAALAVEVEGLSASIVVNEEWQTGMASSLKTGLRAALDADPNAPHAMVLVCDQPRLSLSILRNLLATHAARQPLLTASRYKGLLGVPAIFSSALFPELLRLAGDQGARRILQTHAERAAAVDFPGGEDDIDTPEDLARLNLEQRQ